MSYRTQSISSKLLPFQLGVHVEKLSSALKNGMGWQFDIPPLEQQKRIVAALDVWDRTIEHNERLIVANATKSWLVCTRFW